MNNYERLKKHITNYIEKRGKDWSNKIQNKELKNYLFQCLEKWRALYFNVFLKDERFISIAEPFDENTLVDPCQYYMRLDGSIIFTEATLYDNDGEIICGHPLRFPYMREVKANYFSHNIEPDIFGIQMKCITKVIHNGRKDYGRQIQEAIKIFEAQKNTKYPILPFYFHKQKVNGRDYSIIQTPIFRRENFVVYFPFRKAFEYMYKVKKFEPVVKGADWLLNESHKYPFAKFGKINWSNIGVTGSTSFGDMNDKEDFDVVLLDNIERLRLYRDFIYDGVKNNLFAMISKSRKLRVILNQIKIQCNNNSPMIFCSFLNLENIKNDFLFRCRVNIIGSIDYFEGKVLSDEENMLTPPRVKLCEFKKVYTKTNFWLFDGIYLIPMMGTSRGLYCKGDRIAARNSLIVEFIPEHSQKFYAIVSIGWYDINFI
ncbi:MAG TPA: hypothetical protein PLD27_10000 [bacterium]|nr:hypothetical protein [bacterium]HOL48194.1 hypothetical protein [bacterium]HPQ19605.1 hypothetical protein [bacterium]